MNDHHVQQVPCAPRRTGVARDGARCAVLACVVGALSACASSLWDADVAFGQTVRQARQTQFMNPQAPSALPQVEGTDSGVAKAAVDRYQKSFETLPPAVNVLNIGVGTGASSTGTR